MKNEKEYTICLTTNCSYEYKVKAKDRNEAIIKAKEDLISDLQNKTNDIVKSQWYVCDVDTNLDDDEFVLTHSFGTLKGMGGLE
tara:strand:- start:3440 stop:3691 length:252 start_codon:yes stop_codon:yes gene_type:complete